MEIFTSILVFLVSWWMVFLMILPFNITRTKRPKKGHDTGAPQLAHLWPKALITTLLAALVTAAIQWYVIR